MRHIVRKKNPQRPDLSKVDARDLYVELAERKARVQRLIGKHEQLLAKANELRSLIEAEGGALDLSDAGPVRHRNEVSLANVIRKVLADKKMSVPELTKAVLEQGYKTTSPTLRAIVYQTLIRHPEFKRIARGVYTAKS